MRAQPKADPTILGRDVEVRDLGDAARNLEGTYLIRLFAEFETGRRAFWETFRDTHSAVTDLVNSLSSRQAIPLDLTDQVHRVRKYHNALIHEREDATQPVPIGIARHHLCEYFGRLPPNWT